MLIIRKQKFVQGDIGRLLRDLRLRQVHQNDIYSNHIGALSVENDALRV